VLLAGKYDPVRVKQAFSYLERQKQSDGFEVGLGPDSKSFIRTESADWVAVAYLESLSKPDTWSDSERPHAVAFVQDILQLIAAKQNRDTGGWSPVPYVAGTHDRTYATTMAVWALTEGMLSKDVPTETKQQLAPSLEAGISWLLKHYEQNLGWEENPRYALGKPFPGLTYQILFVLERAQLVPDHNSFRNAEACRRIKKELRNTVHHARIADLTSVPTSYIMVGNYSCWADVLSFPWLLSALPKLIADPDVPSSDRSYLKQLLKDELGHVAELPSHMVQVETWQLAEQLIGVSNFIRSQQAQR